MLISMNGKSIHFNAGSGGGGLMIIAGGSEARRLSAERGVPRLAKPRRKQSSVFTLKASDIYKARKAAVQRDGGARVENGLAFGVLDTSSIYARRKAV